MGLIDRKNELTKKFTDLGTEILVNQDLIIDYINDEDIEALHECHEQINELTDQRKSIVIELSQILRSQEYADELYRAN